MSEIGGLEGDDRSSERAREPESDEVSVTGAVLDTTGSSGAMPVSASAAEAAPEEDMPSGPPAEGSPDVTGEFDRAAEPRKIEAHDKSQPGSGEQFLRELGGSALKEIYWWGAEMAADALVPGASTIVKGVRVGCRIVKEIDTLENADGFDIEVPFCVSEIIPVGMSLKGNYTEDPNGGTFTLHVQGSVSLDGAPAGFVPAINPSASDEPDEPAPGVNQADDLPHTTLQREHRELDELDTATQRDTTKLVRTAEFVAESGKLGGEDVVLAAIPGRIANSEHSLPSPQPVRLADPAGLPGQVEIKGRLETGRTSPQRVLMLVIDGAAGRSTFHYCDPEGWLHLLAMFVVENSEGTVYKA